MRSLGMGGVWATLDQKNEGVSGNPATIDDKQPLHTINGNFLFETLSENALAPNGQIMHQGDDFYQGMLGVSLPAPAELGKIGIAGSYSTSQMDNAAHSDYDSLQISAGWGMHLNDDVSLGYGISVSQDDEESDLADYEMDLGHLHRIGVLAKPFENVKFGAVGLLGFGDTDSDFVGGAQGDGDRHMLGVRLGASYQIGEALLLALDLGYTNYEHDADVTLAGFSAIADEEGDCYDFGIGVEYAFTDRTIGRVGLRGQYLDYHIHNDRQLKVLEYLAPTVGLGIRLSETFFLDIGAEIRPLDKTDCTVGVGLTAVF